MQKVRPLFENILVKPIVKEKKTKGGILLPEDKSQSENVEGQVIEVGTGDTLPVVIKRIGGIEDLAKKPIVVRKGELVVFKQYAGTPILLEGERHFLVNQRDILAVIDYKE